MTRGEVDFRPAEVPVVILCGGRGIWLDGSGERLAKPLVEVAGRPMVLHVVGHYARHGFRRFALAGGYRLEALRRATEPARLAEAGLAGIAIEVVDTGLEAPTGDRLRAAAGFVGEAPRFAATYSDTLSDVDLEAVGRAHVGHGRLATLVAAHVPTRFRVLGMRPGESVVRGFARRPVIQKDWINGGYYLFERPLLGRDWLGSAPSGIVLEEAILERLAAREELVAFPHEGAWQHLDSERDLPPLAVVARGERRP